MNDEIKFESNKLESKLVDISAFPYMENGLVK